MTTEFHVLKLLPSVNIQVERVSVMITQDVVRVNSQGCNGQYLGSDRTRITHKYYCCTVNFCRIISIINQQLHLHNFHIKHFKNTSNHSDMFRSCQIIIRELCCSLLKLYYNFDVWLTVHRSSMWIKRPTRCHF